MNSDRRTSRVAGVLFLITFITAIPALLLFQPVLDDPGGYIAGAGADNRVFLGAFLELLLIIANVGTAVVLFPILKRQNESLALGYVTARVEQGGAGQFIATIPEIAWELSLGIWLTVKGFRPSPILAGDASPAPQTS